MLLLVTACGGQKKTRLVVAATTSLEDTGLLDLLASEFSKAHPEIELSPVAVGTGQALQLGRRGDADVIVSHDSAAETQLVTEGLALERRPVMYNDFVIAGDAQDPAQVRGLAPNDALPRIAAARAMFISRADDSGTHRKEKKLWKTARIDADTISGAWYVHAGVGMGDALLLAGQKRAYILTDRGTFLRLKPRVHLEVLVEHDAQLINNYGVTVMKGEREAAAKVFADWITSAPVQRMIDNYGRAEFGESMFTANGAAPRDTIPTGER